MSEKEREETRESDSDVEGHLKPHAADEGPGDESTDDDPDVEGHLKPH